MTSRETRAANSPAERGAAPKGGQRHDRTTLRRQALGADTARRLLLTVMGEFLLPGGGVAWTSTFIEVLARLGIEPGTTRQALARTATSGWLQSERVGRRTRWRLTPEGEQLLIEGAKRIYEFAGPAVDWDGRWVLVLATVPESDRARRHILRSRLSWAGLGSPSPGVWIGTDHSRVPDIEEILSQVGMADTAQVFLAEHVGSTPLETLVADAWDLQAIEEDYVGFIREFSPATAIDPLCRLIELVHAWRRFPWQDPGLPGVLLPDDWKGAKAAALFHDRHRRWTDAATREWHRISDSG